MPAKEIARLFKEGRLHSGGSGKIVTNPKQALAIRLNYLRDEGKDIPEPKPSRMAEHFRKART
jgi:hypothetical protein